ncbi:MAG: hypothetical protein ABL929_07195 [Ferruginibacter sp.]
MSYHISNISKIIGATILQGGIDASIENILTDSRKLMFPETSVFFALPGDGRNGNNFIDSLCKKF